MGCHFLLQGIFLSQGSNLSLPLAGEITFSRDGNYVLSQSASPGHPKLSQVAKRSACWGTSRTILSFPVGQTIGSQIWLWRDASFKFKLKSTLVSWCIWDPAVNRCLYNAVLGFCHYQPPLYSSEKNTTTYSILRLLDLFSKPVITSETLLNVFCFLSQRVVKP